MQYRLRFEKRAVKDLQKMERADRHRVVASVEKLASNLGGDVKKLAAHDPRYRLRSGNFRILFNIEQDEMVVHRVKDRRDAY